MDSSYRINTMSSTPQVQNNHMNNLQPRLPNHADGQTLPPLGEAPLHSYSAYTVGLPPHPLTTTASYPNVSQPSPANNLSQLQGQRTQPHLNAYASPGPFGMPQSMIQSSQGMMAPAHPASAGPRALPDLHPRPVDAGFLNHIQSAQNMLTPAQGHHTDPEPTHVVGQQGRRGILPSAPGRGPGAVKSAIPQKDANGKYPCPHCTKTYQHAKHLKRHLLRHTGDRPYMCKLCKDTFSRSDILKRHFQKCYQRRGVTGDMDHLEGSRAHLQKNRPSTETTQTIQFLNPVNPSSAYDNGPVSATSQIAPMLGQASYRIDNMQPGSARNSRSNSIVQPANGFLDARRNMSALDQLQTTNGAYGPFSAPPGMPSVLANGIQSATQSPVHGVANGIANGHNFNGYAPAEVSHAMLHEGQRIHQ